MKTPNKYALYERSVQTPERHVEEFVQFYRELNDGKYARHLREDFCGTFKLSCAWIKNNRRNTAVSLDLDPEPLDYGKRHHRSKLSADQKKRLTVLQQNVLSVTTPRSDLIVACNFSFCVFKERKVLIEYFRYALRSLTPGGMLLLEIAGGPGMIEPMRERVPVYEEGKRKFTYVWDQQKYDPITHDAKYAIHFEFPDGRKVKSAFTYDWRLWTIAELRDALKEAGFESAHTYWETEHKGRGTGEYVRMESGDNAYAWIAYVIGTRAKAKPKSKSKSKTARRSGRA